MLMEFYYDGFAYKKFQKVDYCLQYFHTMCMFHASLPITSIPGTYFPSGNFSLWLSLTQKTFCSDNITIRIKYQKTVNKFGIYSDVQCTLQCIEMLSTTVYSTKMPSAYTLVQTLFNQCTLL